jgi:hypothetical protein
MAKRSGVSIRGDFLNFLSGTLSESAAATYRELEIDTNLSAERGVMMEIHSVEIARIGAELLTEVAQGASETSGFHLARESKTSLLSINDKDVIIADVLELARAGTIGTDAGPLWTFFNRYQRYDFAMPIPYVKPSIFFGVIGSDASGFTGANFRIGYTLREIDREDFLSLLVAIQ